MTNNLSKISQTFLTSAGIAFLMFVSSALISRNFGASVLAEIGLLLFCTSLISVFSAIFGGGSIVYVNSRHHIFSIFIISSIATVLSAIFISPIIYFLKWGSVGLGWLLIISFFQGFYTNMLFFLLAKNNTSLYNYIRLLQPVLLLITVGLILGLDSKNIEFYFYGLATSYIIPSTYILLVLKSDLLFAGKIEKKDLRATMLTFLRFGGVSQLTNGIQLLNYRVSLLVVAFFCTQKDVGVMVLALTFVDGIWMFKNSAGLIKYVDTSQNANESKKKDMLYLSMLSLVVTIAISIGVLAIPTHVYLFIFGKDFDSLKQLLIYMLPGILTMSATSIISNYFSGLGKVSINLIVAIVGLIVLLPGIYFLTSEYGIMGAAIANNLPNVIGSLILLIMYTLFIKRRSEVLS